MLYFIGRIDFRAKQPQLILWLKFLRSLKFSRHPIFSCNLRNLTKRIVHQCIIYYFFLSERIKVGGVEEVQLAKVDFNFTKAATKPTVIALRLVNKQVLSDEFHSSWHQGLLWITESLLQSKVS